MTVAVGGPTMTLPADGDNSAGQYCFVTQDANGRADIAAANSEPIVGIQQNKPAAQDRGTTVQIGGVSKLVAGEAVNEQDRLTADASGRGVATTTATHHVGAVALEASAAAGDVIAVLVIPRSFGA